jgi:hypothetical protein
MKIIVFILALLVSSVSFAQINDPLAKSILQQQHANNVIDINVFTTSIMVCKNKISSLLSDPAPDFKSLSSDNIVVDILNVSPYYLSNIPLQEKINKVVNAIRELSVFDSSTISYSPAGYNLIDEIIKGTYRNYYKLFMIFVSYYAVNSSNVSQRHTACCVVAAKNISEIPKVLVMKSDSIKNQ